MKKWLTAEITVPGWWSVLFWISWGLLSIATLLNIIDGG
jgi:hypothetical protein